MLVGLAMLMFADFADAQEDGWQLKRKKDNLEVYTRNIAQNGVKELKLHTQMKTRLNSIFALFDDIPRNADWVYSSKEAKTLKVIAPNHMIYYSVSDFPWPLSDRDLIADSIVKQDPETKVATSTSVATLEGYPEQKGIVRVSVFEAQWTFTPLPDGIVDVVYVVKTDPGGNIPVFLTNMFIDANVSYIEELENNSESDF